jgi:hypothetical protein
MSNVTLIIDGKTYRGTLAEEIAPIPGTPPPVPPAPPVVPVPPQNHNYAKITPGIPVFGIRLNPGQRFYFMADTSAAVSRVNVGMASVDQSSAADCNMLLTTEPSNIDTWYTAIRQLYDKTGAWGGNCTWPLAKPVAFARMSHATSGESVQINGKPAAIWGVVQNEGTVQAEFNLSVVVG